MTRAALAVAALWLAAPVAADAAADDEAFFEFLGSFEDDDGGWIDPLELERAAQVPGPLAPDARDDDDDDNEIETVDDE